jgi:geranylgeranyl diphosphate synthase type I
MTIALPTTLLRARDSYEPALRKAVTRLDRRSAELASYHFGWTDADGNPTAAGGGKAVRPALALLSAQAVGADWSVAVPGAVAVELVHNFSLLHDDLMDGDVERRHRATVWAQWGSPAAILCGDAMLALATQVLLETATLDAVAAARLLGNATQELIRGQYDDLAFEERDDVDVAECVEMAAGKTGALLSCAASIGAVLAGASRAEVRGLATYGAELGLAFQLVDDLLGIWGDPQATGKPVGSDLRARKKSLPIAWATTHGGATGRELAAWLRTEGPDSDAAIAHAAELVEAAGGRAWAEEEARRRLSLGETALASAALEPAAHDELVMLGRFIVTRES